MVPTTATLALSSTLLRQEDIDKLWLPHVIYENTDQMDTTRIGRLWEWTTDVFVMREGNFTSSRPKIFLDETAIFKGKENSLVMRQTYTREFQCSYKHTRYPFDTQVCSIDMVMSVLDRTTVSLVPDKLAMIQELDMAALGRRKRK